LIRDPKDGPPTGDASAEESDPEVAAVLEGRDHIQLEEELLQEPMPPARREALSLRIRKMTVAERVKLALNGNKEARQILVRDPVKLVQSCILRNPRVTVDEALVMAKNRSLSGELLRRIAGERDWVRQYSVRISLVQNPKTPLQVALSLLPGIQERDMRAISKSKNVSSVLQSQARRILARKSPGSGGSGG
jgi:hypothetical protein